MNSSRSSKIPVALEEAPFFPERRHPRVNRRGSLFSLSLSLGLAAALGFQLPVPVYLAVTISFKSLDYAASARVIWRGHRLSNLRTVPSRRRTGCIVTSCHRHSLGYLRIAPVTKVARHFAPEEGDRLRFN